MAKTLTPYERESVITLNDEDEMASIFTHQSPVITRLKKNPAAVLIEEGTFGRTKWARFELPKDLLSFRTKRKTKSTSNLP